MEAAIGRASVCLLGFVSKVTVEVVQEPGLNLLLRRKLLPSEKWWLTRSGGKSNGKRRFTDTSSRGCMEKLKDIQAELLKINMEASAKIYEVKLQSFEIMQPMFQKRNEIIKTIPVFWLIAFMGHPRLKQIITERDQKILAYLSSLDVRFGEGYNSDYAIFFIFDPNPYFENKLLARLYSYCDDGTITRNCTEISWKDYMKVIKKGTSRESEGKKCILYEERCSNDFVSWLGQSQIVTLPTASSDEIARIIIEELWPNPMEFLYKGAEEGEFEEVEHVSVAGDEGQKGENDVRDTAGS